MDIGDKNKRSKVMSRIRSQDTKPELLVRKYLYKKGYRYRKNVRKLPGTPDIVLRKYAVAIFIHGCFWHGHESHIRYPKSNIEFWEKKIKRNIERDEENKRKLKELGWNVMTVWECQLKPRERAKTLQEIEYLINKGYIDRIAIEGNVFPIAAEEEAVYGNKKALE